MARRFSACHTCRHTRMLTRPYLSSGAHPCQLAPLQKRFVRAAGAPELVEGAMRLYGTRSKKETVDLALRRLVGARLSVDEAIALEGSGWEGDLDPMREDAPPDTA